MFTFGFYNSQNSDRMYDATQMSELFDGLIKDGVFSSIGDHLSTIPGDGLQVIVKPGRAWFNHTWNKLDSNLPLNLEAPDITLSRYDAVVLEVGTKLRTNEIKIVKGANSFNPVHPTLVNNDDVHQYPLAYVRVNNAAQSITASNIEIMVGRDPCPFVIGIMKTADISDMFNQWDGEFDDWLDETKKNFNKWYSNIQDQLSGDIAANLQRQIDLKLNISDKATTPEAVAGTNDTKYVTPLSLSQAIKQKAVQSHVGEVIFSTTDLEHNQEGVRPYYMLCDGRSLSKSSYPDLYNAIGDKYGGLSVKDTVINSTIDGRYSSGNSYYIVCEEDPSIKFAILIPSSSDSGQRLVLIEGSTTYELSYGSYNRKFYGAFFIGKTPYIITDIFESYSGGDDVSSASISKIEKNGSSLKITQVLNSPGSGCRTGDMFLFRFNGSVYIYMRKATTSGSGSPTTLFLFRVGTDGAYLLGSHNGSTSYTGETVTCFYNKTLYIKETSGNKRYWRVSLDNPQVFTEGYSGIPSGIKSFLDIDVNANVVWSNDRTKCVRFDTATKTLYQYSFSLDSYPQSSTIKTLELNVGSWTGLSAAAIGGDSLSDVYFTMTYSTGSSSSLKTYWSVLKTNFADPPSRIENLLPTSSATSRTPSQSRCAGEKNILTYPSFLRVYTYKYSSDTDWVAATIGTLEANELTMFSLPDYTNKKLTNSQENLAYIRIQ